MNVHSHEPPGGGARADTQRAAIAARAWAGGAPLVFGGDVNLSAGPSFPGCVHVAGNHVDHLFTDGARRPARRGARPRRRCPTTRRWRSRSPDSMHAPMRALLALAAIGLVVLAACGGDDDGGGARLGRAPARAAR